MSNDLEQRLADAVEKCGGEGHDYHSGKYCMYCGKKTGLGDMLSPCPRHLRPAAENLAWLEAHFKSKGWWLRVETWDGATCAYWRDAIKRGNIVGQALDWEPEQTARIEAAIRAAEKEVEK